MHLQFTLGFIPTEGAAAHSSGRYDQLLNLALAFHSFTCICVFCWILLSALPSFEDIRPDGPCTMTLHRLFDMYE